MAPLSSIGTGVVALIHVYITILEMALWTKPRGRKAFGLSAEFAEKTKTLGANQGLYNGFLAAGLSWSIIHPIPEFSKQLQHFFLGCVLVAGTYGAATASRKILFVQAIPALVVLGFVQLGV
ncbi:uncharacterized protein F5Z01DRAFT_554586 [Emericellopsis atlantica]|uniref:Integral membrane protein n=1 Tax=Emericellopsis atlantica TaxID=2614577 RepID=A0A9P7ZP64_9HYPO|nr:uncharacterized protein F5Z01DRAFT_554586 [Emericellopsis atlantica]KAG9255724.1 integral membrane protein [Emericellopsis atlantica]